MGHETANRSAFEHLRLTHNYVLALFVIMLMTVAGYFFTQYSLEKQRITSDRNQVANRQRIFCERIMKTVEDVLVAESDSERAFSIQNLSNINELFVGSHHMIVAGDERLGLTPESQEDIRKLLLEIRPFYDKIQIGLQAFLSNNDSLRLVGQADMRYSPTLQMLLIGQAGYLNTLDDIIMLYNARLEREVASLQSILGWLVMFVLFILVCVGLLIFRPAVGKTRQALLEKNIAIENLTEEVDNRQKVEEALRWSEERYRTLFNSGRDFVFVFALEPSRLLEVNDITVHRLRYSRDELAALAPDAIFHADMLRALHELAEEENIEESLLLETTLYGRDTVIPVEVNLHRVELESHNAVLGVARDISERKMAEETIRESEERFGNLFLFSNDGIIIHTLSGYIIDVNQKFLNLTGFTRDEILSKTIRELQPENAYIANSKARRELEKNGFVNFEVEFRKAEGGYFNAEVSASVFHHNGMEVVQGIVRDITERKESDEMNAALHRIAEKASFSFDMEEFYAAIHQIVGKLMYAGNFYIALSSGAGEQIDIVYSAGESSGVDNRRDFAADVTRQALGSRETLLFSGDRVEKMAFAAVGDAGTEYPREALAAPLKFEGRAIGALVLQNYSTMPQFKAKDKELLAYVAQHIAHALQRRQTLDDLATERRWLNATLSSIADGVVTTNLSGEVLLFNAAAENLSGIASHTASGSHFDDVLTFYQDEECRRRIYLLSDVLGNGELVAYEQVYLRQSEGGDTLTISLRATPIRSETGQIAGAVIALHDISQRLYMEQALQKNERLESIGLLAAGIAHDFNNYLTAILGNISLAIEFIDQPDRLHKRLIDTNAAALVAKKLVDQLRDFSREGAPVMRAASIGDLVRETAGFVLRGRPVSLQYKIDEDLWPISGDISQLSRVITNLLINADQAMPRGGNIIVECRNLEISEIFKTGGESIPPGKYVTIGIRDNGQGIEESELPRIFEMNYTTKKRGSGIGLATSRSIIDKHRGFISVISKPDEGTLFTIYLPGTPKATPVAGNKPNTLEKGNGRILVMDDEEPVRQVISRMLSTLGYQPGVARDGQEALELYRKGLDEGVPFDLVILDLLIPGSKGGQETMTDLLEIDPQAKGIVVSGNSHDPVMGEYQRFGFAGRMIKPFSIVDIGRIVKEVLN